MPAATSHNQGYQDLGISAAGKAAMDPAADDTNWLNLAVPCAWSKYGDVWAKADGEAVYRRRFVLPDAWVGLPLKLYLGPVDDVDETLVNGVQVGKTTVAQPGVWTFQRIYSIPAKVLRRGENLLCVRVFDRFGEGGIMGPEDKIYLRPDLPPVVVIPPVGVPPKN